MMNKLLRLLLALTFFLPSDISLADITVNGQAKKMQLEKLSSDPTSSEARVYYNTTSKKPFIYNGTAWTGLGGGSGGGVENFITNGRAEDVTVTGVSTYDDGAVAAPLDCTGGSPATLTAAARNTSSPISELADYSLAKSAANGQGEGWAFTVTLPANNPAAVAGWQAAFDAMIRTSAAYVSGDMGIWVYDVTNATAPVKITDIAASTQTFTGPWPWSTSGTSASYRICFHVQTTSALAYSVNADNVYAGIEKGQPVPSTPYEYMGAFSTNILGYTTNVQAQGGNYWRNGDKMLFIGGIEFSGTNTQGTAVPALPTGYTIDASKLFTGFTSTGDALAVGGWTYRDPGSGITYSGAVYYDTGSAALRLGYNDANGVVRTDSGGTTGAPSPTTVADNDSISWRFEVPIAEWSNPSYSADAGNCEYAATSGTWDAADSTTVYGSGGALMGGALGDQRIKTITWTKEPKFIRVLGSTDRIFWSDINNMDITNTGGYVTRVVESAGGLTDSGVSVRQGTAANQTRIVFHEHVRVEVDGSSPVEWPSNAYWVVENCPTAAGSITFADGTSGKRGINYGTQYLYGEADAVANATETDFVSDNGVQSVALKAGLYEMHLSTRFRVTAATTPPTDIDFAALITDTSNNVISSISISTMDEWITRDYRTPISSMRIISLASDTSVKLRCSINVTGGTGTITRYCDVMSATFRRVQ